MRGRHKHDGRLRPDHPERRDQLQRLLAERVPGLTLNGHPSERLPNTLNVSFLGVDGEELLVATPAVVASTGTACHAGCSEPSAVLMAMGIARERALGTVRLSLGKFTTVAEVEDSVGALAAAWQAMSGGAAT